MLNRRYLIITTILLLFFAAVVTAQSQRPSPSLGEKGKPIQKQTRTDTQQSEHDQRGTEKSPLVVKTINPPKTEAEVNQERKDRDKKASNDRWFLFFTGLLAFFAFLQLGALIWQAYSLKCTLKITQETTNIAKESAEAARTSADALKSAERAYVFARVQLNNSDKLEENRIKVDTLGLLGQNCAIVIVSNHGKTPAILMNINYFSNVFDNYAAIDDYLLEITSKSDPVIPPGVEIINSGEEKIYTTYFSMPADLWKNIIDHDSKLICIGLIQYKDIFGELHKTVFCWQYHEIPNGFYPVYDRKYNYCT